MACIIWIDKVCTNLLDDDDDDDYYNLKGVIALGQQL